MKAAHRCCRGKWGEGPPKRCRELQELDQGCKFIQLRQGKGCGGLLPCDLAYCLPLPCELFRSCPLDSTLWMEDPALEISELIKETEALQTRIQVLQVRYCPPPHVFPCVLLNGCSHTPLLWLLDSDSSKLLATQLSLVTPVRRLHTDKAGSCCLGAD